MKCYLHIGTEKTGTTLLQNWLYDNREELSTIGVYLSDKLGGINNRLVPAYFQRDMDYWAATKGIANEQERSEYFSGFLEIFSGEISKAKIRHHAFVITSEHISSSIREIEDIKLLHVFLAKFFHEVEVICYFREQYDMAVSRYSTALRSDFSEDIECYVDTINPEFYLYNYLSMADKWSEVFGARNCNFRIYDRKCFIDQDIRIDFLSTISSDINFKNFNMERISSNESLYYLQSTAYKLINRKISYWKPNKLGVNINNLTAKSKVDSIDSLKVGRILSSKQDVIRARFREVNNKFFSKYFETVTEFPKSKARSANYITAEEASRAVEDVLGFGLDCNGDVVSSLTEDEINLIRDIALAIYSKRPLSVSDALQLMKVALNHKPNGSLIKRKVNEWSLEIKTNTNTDE